MLANPCRPFLSLVSVQILTPGFVFVPSLTNLSLSWTLVKFSVGLCVVVSRVYDSVLGEHSNSVVSDGLAFKLCRDAADFPLFSLASREGRLFGSLDP